MKIGLVGYQGSGKSTLFHWLTEIEPEPSAAHTGQNAMATIEDERLEQLHEIYQPKKITRASLEIFDTPGLSRSHEGSAARLASIREAGCLAIVVAGFGDHDPASDLSSFEDDLLIADLEIMTGRLERLRESVKKPRPNRDEQLKELAALEPLHALLEDGKRLHDVELTPEQEKATRSFQLLTEKPRLLIINTNDEEQQAGDSSQEEFWTRLGRQLCIGSKPPGRDDQGQECGAEEPGMVGVAQGQGVFGVSHDPDRTGCSDSCENQKGAIQELWPSGECGAGQEEERQGDATGGGAQGNQGIVRPE